MPRSNGSSSDTPSGYCSLCYLLNLNGEDEQLPRHKTSGWNSKWVWPRDKGNGGRWSRLKDVCSGKGPDIFVTSQRSRGPYRIEWSNWSIQQLQNGGCYSGSVLDNLGYPCGNHHHSRPLSGHVGHLRWHMTSNLEDIASHGMNTGDMSGEIFKTIESRSTA